MDHRIDAMRREELPDERTIARVTHDELGARDRSRMPVLERVEHDDIVTESAQDTDRMRADVSGATGDEDAHGASQSERRLVRRTGRAWLLADGRVSTADGSGSAILWERGGRAID